MLSLSFAVPTLVSQPGITLSVTFVIAGLILAALLSGIMASFNKALPESTG